MTPFLPSLLPMLRAAPGCRAWNALFAAAFVLVVAMGTLSPPCVHPDERVGLASVRYYETRWAPADIRDPAAAASVSSYGVSRLDQRTVYWMVAGKVYYAAKRLFPRWQVPERAFNILLFALLLAFYIRRGRDNPWLYLPVGLSPQIWYLFSYCTSDAWDLVLCLLVFHETAFSGSLLWRSVLGGSPMSGEFHHGIFDAERPARKSNPADVDGPSVSLGQRVLGLFLVGSLFGLLSLGKSTVLAAFLVAGIVILRRLVALPPRTLRKAILPLAAVVLIAVSWSVGATLSEYARYGSRHDEIREEVAVALRHPDFVPDERGIVRHFSVNLRLRGESLLDTLVHRHPPFLPTVLASFTGSYGIMRYPSPRPWYAAVGLCWLGMSLCCVVRLVRSRPRLPDLMAVTALAAVPVLLLAAAAWHAWTADYQPQGRYLFPSNVAWAAIGALVPACPKGNLAESVSRWFFTLLLVLGLCSLLFWGVVPMSDIPATLPAGNLGIDPVSL